MDSVTKIQDQYILSGSVQIYSITKGKLFVCYDEQYEYSVLIHDCMVKFFVVLA
jgi:hypothetical protein